MKVERWWATDLETLSAGWHPWRWHFGINLDLMTDHFAIHMGPITLQVSWWGLKWREVEKP